MHSHPLRSTLAMSKHSSSSYYYHYNHYDYYCYAMCTSNRLKALSALACLVTDDSEEVFTSDLIHFLLLHFSSAILDQDHQSCYCSAASILCGKHGCMVLRWNVSRAFLVEWASAISNCVCNFTWNSLIKNKQTHSRFSVLCFPLVVLSGLGCSECAGWCSISWTFRVYCFVYAFY